MTDGLIRIKPAPDENKYRFENAMDALEKAETHYEKGKLPVSGKE